MQRFFAVLTALIFGLSIGLPHPATASHVANLKGTPAQFGHPRPKTSDEIKAEKDQAKRLNEERQRRLKEDTDKLLKLATELKEYVDKTNENILSLDVIRKSEEIEKLAKSVREKMKMYYTAGEEQQPLR